MNPHKGALYAENLPSEWVVETSAPFMGEIVSKPTEWSPESTQFVDLQVKSNITKATLHKDRVVEEVKLIVKTEKINEESYEKVVLIQATGST